MPVVSVIIPAFNTAPYIRTAIESAARQSVRDIEIIVVDDGSTDGTLAIARSCAQDDGRVQVFAQQNAGPSVARNRALELARGTCFAFLDSDDEWAPTFLERQLAALERFPSADVITGNAFNRGGQQDGRPYRAIRPHEQPIGLMDMIEHEDAVCIMSLFRRSVYDTIGGFDESLSGNEDYDFWLRAARAGFQFVQTFEPLGYYRRRPESASLNEPRMLEGILRVYRTFRETCHSPVELAAVNRQIERFEREKLAVEARGALRRRDFTAAAASFRELYQRTGDARGGALVVLSRVAPRLLFWLANARRSVRATTHVSAEQRPDRALTAERGTP